MLPPWPRPAVAKRFLACIDQLDDRALDVSADAGAGGDCHRHSKHSIRAQR
jgi:hypothetical protein